MIRRLSVRWRITLVAAGLFAIALGLALLRARARRAQQPRRRHPQHRPAAARRARRRRSSKNDVPRQVDFAGQPPRGTSSSCDTSAASSGPAGRHVVPANPRAPRRLASARSSRPVRSSNRPEGDHARVAASLAEVDDTVNSITDVADHRLSSRSSLLVGLLTWYFAGAPCARGGDPVRRRRRSPARRSTAACRCPRPTTRSRASP